MQDNPQLALKSLRQKNDLVDLLKRRLSVLQIKEEKNSYRAISNEQRYSMHCSLRDALSHEQQLKQQRIADAHKRLQISKQCIHSDKMRRKEGIQQAKGKIIQEKAKINKLTRQQSNYLQSVIKMKNQEEIKEKISMKNQILQYQEQQKKSVVRYFNIKKSQLIEKQTHESNKYKQIEEIKNKQLQQLTRIESAMIQRHSRSIKGFQESAAKLKTFLPMIIRPQRKTPTGSTKSNDEMFMMI